MPRAAASLDRELFGGVVAHPTMCNQDTDD
jgi:hypothetical protein